MPHAFVEVALDADLTDIGVDAVKTGMLTSADTIRSVAKKMKEYNVSNICVDPVMISTSGSHVCSNLFLQTIVIVLILVTVIARRCRIRLPHGSLSYRNDYHTKSTRGAIHLQYSYRIRDAN